MSSENLAESSLEDPAKLINEIEAENRIAILSLLFSSLILALLFYFQPDMGTFFSQTSETENSPAALISNSPTGLVSVLTVVSCFVGMFFILGLIGIQNCRSRFNVVGRAMREHVEATYAHYLLCKSRSDGLLQDTKAIATVVQNNETSLVSHISDNFGSALASSNSIVLQASLANAYPNIRSDKSFIEVQRMTVDVYNDLYSTSRKYNAEVNAIKNFASRYPQAFRNCDVNKFDYLTEI